MFTAFAIALFAVFWSAIVGFVTFIQSYQPYKFFWAETFQELDEEQRGYRRMWRWSALPGALFGMMIASELEADSKEIRILYNVWVAL